MKQALVIRHLMFEDLGSLAPVLRAKGYEITYLEAGSNDLSHINPLEPELVIILGGPIGAYDDQDYPFIQDELHLLEQRLKVDAPTLGICLGAQLMARALGAKVYPGNEKEIGWFPIQLTAAGAASSLRYLAQPGETVLHWHGDTFDLPQGATHLASSEKYPNQAFAWGNCGLALQFHPEVTKNGLERWFIGHACEINHAPGVTVAELRQETEKYSQSLEVQGEKCWQGWLEQIEAALLV
ncbi:glutamine amidotransferase [Crocosphaera sp. XPORK-15E]|uniref:glutamine amidotransferase n=1 Tax=Crocosphaera sp. XPORK-15E TaxID=3110247 RepID=UPI002B202D48|nr:glutamine amidotransferase [Crocosphaera sp. XPORK-15E]MEA5535837.1 glutamine amidotransferase [Crocosphaera sp. XPORK-15E]